MRITKIGAAFLATWSLLNLIVAAVVTALTLAGRSPPALSLMLNEAEISALDPRVLGVVNAQAAIVNPLIVLVCVLVLASVWKGVLNGQRWVLWSLAAALVPVQIFGFVSDGFIGHHNVIANCVSTTLLLLGLAFCGVGLRTDNRNTPPSSTTAVLNASIAGPPA